MKQEEKKLSLAQNTGKVLLLRPMPPSMSLNGSGTCQTLFARASAFWFPCRALLVRLSLLCRPLLCCCCWKLWLDSVCVSELWWLDCDAELWLLVVVIRSYGGSFLVLPHPALPRLCLLRSLHPQSLVRFTSVRWSATAWSVCGLFVCPRHLVPCGVWRWHASTVLR